MLGFCFFGIILSAKRRTIPQNGFGKHTPITSCAVFSPKRRPSENKETA